jgi:hypothetical protein
LRPARTSSLEIQLTSSDEIEIWRSAAKDIEQNHIHSFSTKIEIKSTSQKKLAYRDKIHAHLHALLCCFFLVASRTDLTGRCSLDRLVAHRKQRVFRKAQSFLRMSDDEWETEEEVSDEDQKSKASKAAKQESAAPVDSQNGDVNTVPEFTDLVQAVALVKAAFPDYGQKRILTAVKAGHPQWAVSEKRLQKAIAECGSSNTDSGGYRSGKGSAASCSEPVQPVDLDENGSLTTLSVSYSVHVELTRLILAK